MPQPEKIVPFVPCYMNAIFATGRILFDDFLEIDLNVETHAHMRFMR